MTALGHRVLTAKNGCELIEMLDSHAIDLVIFDPELSFLPEKTAINSIKDKAASVPVIIHSFRNGSENTCITGDRYIFIEKESTSVEAIKKEVENIFR